MAQYFHFYLFFNEKNQLSESKRYDFMFFLFVTLISLKFHIFYIQCENFPYLIDMTVHKKNSLNINNKNISLLKVYCNAKLVGHSSIPE